MVKVQSYFDKCNNNYQILNPNVKPKTLNLNLNLML